MAKQIILEIADNGEVTINDIVIDKDEMRLIMSFLIAFYNNNKA